MIARVPTMAFGTVALLMAWPVLADSPKGRGHDDASDVSAMLESGAPADLVK